MRSACRGGSLSWDSSLGARSRSSRDCENWVNCWATCEPKSLCHVARDDMASVTGGGGTGAVPGDDTDTGAVAFCERRTACWAGPCDTGGSSLSGYAKLATGALNGRIPGDMACVTA